MSKQKRQVISGQSHPIEGHPRKCPQCGKKFYPTSQWAYRNKTKTYCSWKCLREDEAGIPPHPGEAAPPRVMPEEVVTRVEEANERAAKQSMRPVITPAASKRQRHAEEEQKRYVRDYFRLYQEEGLTQQEAADRLGISFYSLKKWIAFHRDAMNMPAVKKGCPHGTNHHTPRQNLSGAKTAKISAALHRMNAILADLNEEVRSYGRSAG